MNKANGKSIKSLLLTIVGIVVGLILIALAIKEADVGYGIRGGILLAAGIALYFVKNKKHI